MKLRDEDETYPDSSGYIDNEGRCRCTPNGRAVRHCLPDAVALSFRTSINSPFPCSLNLHFRY